MLSGNGFDQDDPAFSCLSAAEFRQLAKIMGKLVECGDRALGLLEFLARKDAVRA